MDPITTFLRLGVALALGLLVGLQRERVESPLAGIRTFALIALTGGVSGVLAQQFGGWILAAGGLALAVLLLAGNLAKLEMGRRDPGITTETAAVLMYLVGAYSVVGELSVAVACGGTIALLLHWKEPLHQFAGRLKPEDFRAIMQFALISLVILPVLPNRTYDPWDVLNPREIWLMVVLIVGISLGGYVAYQLFGHRVGTVLAGVLGGTISSTATTVSFARRTAAAADHAGLAALVIMISSSVAFGRVIIEVFVAAPSQSMSIVPPLAVMLSYMFVLAVIVYLVVRHPPTTLPAQGNPAELRAALVFGALYAVVLLAVAIVREYFGSAGLYVVAVLSGLTDMDAITLSTARLVERGKLAADTGWRVILLAALANLLFKGAVVVALGSRALTLRIVLLFTAAAAGAAGLLYGWPAGV